MTDETLDPTTVVASRDYAAPPETVFAAWTDPQVLEQWFGPPGFRARVLSHDLRVGGDWRFAMEDAAGGRAHHFGTFIEIVPPRRLVFTWGSEEQVEGWRDAEGNLTVVCVEITPRAAGSSVRVTHENLSTEMARQGLTAGWSGGLACLGDHLRTMERVR